jgi:hypothetical protein
MRDTAWGEHGRRRGSFRSSASIGPRELRGPSQQINRLKRREDVETRLSTAHGRPSATPVRMAPWRSVYSCLQLLVARQSMFVGAVRSGLGLTRKFAAVALDWLENLARAAGGSWTGSKIWQGLLVAS